MSTLTVSRLIAATAAITTTLLLTACGGGGSADPSSSVSSASPSEASASSSASSSSSSESSESSSSKGSKTPIDKAKIEAAAATEVPTTGAKVAGTALAKRMSTAAEKKGSVQFDMSSTGADSLAGSGSVKGTGAKAELQIDADIRGSKVEILKTGSNVYLKSPTPVGGKPWLKITPGSKDPLSAVYTTIFGGFEGATDVVKMSGYVAKMGTFREAGTEELDGVKTTKYVGAPPASVGTKMLPSSYQALGTEALKTAKTTVSLWLDAEGLLYRSAVVFDMRDVPGVKTLTEYHDWGKSVNVAAPPASQVATSANLASPTP